MGAAPLDAARWATLQALLEAALDLGPDARAAFVARHAAGDPALAAELEALLAAADDVPAFLDAGLDGAGAGLDGPGLEADLAGRTIGPYRLVRELGRGGQGRVFLAERDDLGTRVALKVLRGGLAGPDLARRFRTEQSVMAGLDHPHIARLLDAGTAEAGPAGERVPYTVMEAVEGVPLTDDVEAHGRGLEARLRLFLQVCDAVAYAHRHLVVHRDLKPSNVLVTATDGGPRVKLLDFGIAKLLGDGEAVATRTGMGPMTPEYAAPEQVTGRPVTVATDVYALGALLYELLTGARPLDTSGGLVSVVRAVSEEVPERPSARVAADRGRRLRGDLDAIALKALEKDPADRYGSVDALADDVRRHLAGLPVRARRPTVRYRASRFVRRHAVGVGVTVLGLALAAGLGAREAALRADAEAARDEAQATVDFLFGMFDAHTDALATEERVDTLSTLGLLDRSAAGLDADTARAPRLRSLLHLRLGQIFVGLGHEERGRRQFEAALAPPGLDDAVRAEALFSGAMNAHALGDCAGAVEAFDRAAPLYRDALGDEAGWMSVRSSRSTALACVGAFDRAVADARAALAYFRDDPDDDGVGYHLLADVLNQAGRADEAVEAMRAGVEAADARYPVGHPVPVARRLYLAGLLEGGGRPDEAFAPVRRALRESLARNGPAHVRTLDAQDRLAGLLLGAGRAAEAAPVVEALERTAAGLPASDLRPRFHAVHRRAALEAHAGRLGAAERAALEAVRRADALPEAFAADRARARATLAEVRRLRGLEAEG